MRASDEVEYDALGGEGEGEEEGEREGDVDGGEGGCEDVGGE